MINDIVGKVLDSRYEILALSGSGGMANVYKAKDRETDNIVAVKILRDEFLDNPELVRRFKNESKAISLLNHNNIVKVFDVSVSEEIQYIVMEYIEGMQLSAYIERSGGKLTWKVTVFFIEQILSALSHAHEKGVVHRDVKPQNIMLLQDGSVKVMDFGIARLSRSDSRTITEKAIGSVHYISPEQAKGDTTDPKADIYSVGIMMYEMLTGILPFEAESAVSVAIKQISDTAIQPREIDPTIPEGLEEIVMRAMAKEPDDRYPSCSLMTADIAEFKKNPSIKFAYTYLSDDEQTKFIDKVTTRNNNKKQTTSKENVLNSRNKTKKKKKTSILIPVMLGLATAFAFGGAALVLLIFNMSGSPLFATFEDVELPTFIGMSADELDDEYDFRFLIEEVYSNEHPIGTVVDQIPKPPKLVKENAQITIKVSKGIEIVTVPDLYGERKTEAELMLIDLGLIVTVENVIDETGTMPFSYVMGTDPVAGTELSSGSSITLYSSAATLSNVTFVPQITGISQTDAQELLLNSQLYIGSVANEVSTQPPGTILSQSPEAGTEVEFNTSVNVVVAIAPSAPPVTVDPETGEVLPVYTIPNIVGMTGAQAQAANPTIQMNYDDDFDQAGGAAGIICFQAPAAGTQSTSNAMAYGIYLG